MHLTESYISGENRMQRVTDRLYIGSWIAAKELAQGKSTNHHDIGVLINLTEDSYPVAKNSGIVVYQFAFDDGYPIPADKFWLALNQIFDGVRDGKNVMVHCHAGVSRSATILTSYLYLTGVFSFEKALELVQSKRAVVDPSTVVLLSAKKHLRLWPYHGGYDTDEQSTASESKKPKK